MTALEDMGSLRLPVPDPRQKLRKLCAVNHPDVPLERERARAVGNFARGDVDALVCLARALGLMQVAQRVDAGACGLPTLASDERDASRLGELEVGSRTGETGHGVAVVAEGVRQRAGKIPP